MSNYTKTTDFEAKDSLPTGDSGKIIRGAEFETEFDAIATAIATKADTAGPTFTGTLTFETISDGSISVTAFVDEDDMSSNSATLVPTQQSVKAYVDSVTTELQAQDLDFQADSGGALSIDLDTETMTFTGGTGIDTSGSGNAVTFAIDSTVATLTGSQTLTNKTLTAPVISTISNTGTITLPTSTDTLVGRATTDTLTNKTLTSAVLNTGVSGTAVLDEDNMASNSATQLATQQSIKAYVDSQVAGADTLAEVLGNGNTTGGTDIAVGTGDHITFADSSMAKFGAGNDLQIYHNGSHSFISEAGTGDLYIGASNNIAFMNAAFSENKLLATTDGALKLYYDGSQKLATTSTGIDVTGAITSSGNLTVNGADVTITANIIHSGDSNTYFGFPSNDTFRIVTAGSEALRVNSSQNVGIGTSSPDGKLHLSGTGSAPAKLIWERSDGGVGSKNWTAYIDNTHDLLFGKTDDSGTLTHDYLHIEDGGNIGIGTSSLIAKMHVKGAGTSSSTNAIFAENSSGAGIFAIRDNGDAFILGNTGIGTSSPSSVLHVKSTSSATATIEAGSGGDAVLDLKAAEVSGGESIIRFSDSVSGVGFITYAQNDGGSDFMRFGTASLERMRLDSSGNLLVGATTTTSLSDGTGNDGVQLNPSGTIAAARTSNVTAVFNRLSTDGEIARFNKDGSTVGSIGSNSSSYLYIGLGDTTLSFSSASDLIYPTGTNGAQRDGAVSLGNGANRFKDIYLSGGIKTNNNTIDINSGSSNTVATFTSTDTEARIDLVDTTGSAQIRARNDLRFYVNGGSTRAVDINTSGTLLVGKTSSGIATDGVEARGAGFISATANDQIVGYFNRRTSDGQILDLRKDNSTVGSIGTVSSEFYIAHDNTTDSGLRFRNGIIQPCNASGGSNDAAVSLGQASMRFSDLYLSGGVYLGGTGSANHLDDYEEGTFTATLKGATSEPGTLITATSAKYTKVGNRVHFAIGFENKDTTGYAGVISISGLPFTTGGPRAVVNVVHYATTTWTAGQVPIAIIGTSQTTIDCLVQISNSAWASSNHSAGAGRYLWLSGTYQSA